MPARYKLATGVSSCHPARKDGALNSKAVGPQARQNREEEHVVEKTKQYLQTDDELCPSRLREYVAITSCAHGYDTEVERVSQIEFGRKRICILAHEVDVEHGK